MSEALAGPCFLMFSIPQAADQLHPAAHSRTLWVCHILHSALVRTSFQSPTIGRPWQRESNLTKRETQKGKKRFYNTLQTQPTKAQQEPHRGKLKHIACVSHVPRLPPAELHSSLRSTPTVPAPLLLATAPHQRQSLLTEDGQMRTGRRFQT